MEHRKSYLAIDWYLLMSYSFITVNKSFSESLIENKSRGEHVLALLYLE